MRLRRIKADGFLSFDGLDLFLDNRVTMLVGPNGHGKSNFGHVLRCVYTALASADRDTPELQATLTAYLSGLRRRTLLDAADRSEAGGRGLRLQLDIELTSTRERHLVTTFLRAVAVHQLVGNTTGYNIDPINEWAAATITEDKLKPLHQLSVIVAHAGYSDSQWLVTAAFDHAESDASTQRFEWTMRGWGMADEIAREGDLIEGIGSHAASTYATVASQAIGGHREDTSAPQTPVADFSFAHLVPQDPAGAVQSALDLGTLVTPHTRAFTDAIGVDVRGFGDNNRRIGLSRVLRVIFDEALMLSDDERLATPSETRRLGTDPRSMATTERLAERLLRLKNSRSADRAPFDRITSRFAALSNGRQIDVALVPTPEASRGQSHEGETGSLGQPVLLVSVKPVPPGDRSEVSQVPIEFAGAGAGEALLLACVLEAPRDAVVFLDEPGATLHPTAQRRLSAYLADSGAQFIVVSHSPYLVPYATPDQIDLCRVQLDDKLRSLPRPVSSELLFRLAPKIIAKGNQGLPFAAAVVLCEGQSDTAFIAALARRLDLAIEEANVLLVDCGSRDNQPDYISFVTALGLRHLVVMDGDAAKAATQPETAKAVGAVRDAVYASGLSTLVEFPEDVETTLGVAKGKAATVAHTVDIENVPVMRELVAHLRRIVGGPTAPEPGL